MNTLSAAVTAAQNIKQRDYWLDKLSGPIEKGRFPYETHKSVQPLPLEREVRTYIHKLDPGLSARLVRMSNGSDSRLFMILTAGLTALIYKYTGNRDVIIGTSIYKQEINVELINRVLALRNHVAGDMTFKELLLQVKQTHGEAIENQDYPFETLVHKLNLPVNVTGEEFPLFETAILLENIHERSYIEATHPSLLFYFSRYDESLENRVEYDSWKYTRETVERILRHFENLLSQALLGVETRLGCLEILAKQEKEQVLYDFNGTRVGDAVVPAIKPISCLISEAAAKHPCQIVADYQDQQLTFKTLEQRVDLLALEFRKKAVKPGVIVALVLDKSLEMVIAMLGVLKSGAAYLPILPGYPPERIGYMIRESRPYIILTHTQYVSQLKDIVGDGAKAGYPRITAIESVDFHEAGYKNGLACIIRVSNPAYVMYTSGTTGNPKGVLVEHGNVVNTITWFGNHYRLQPGMHVMQLTDYTFDPSVEQIFSALVYGASVCLASAVAVGNAVSFARYIEQKQVYLINFVPTMLKQLLCYDRAPKLKPLQIIISGGERLDDSLKNEILAKGYTLYNQYGPTEITVDALVTMCSPEKPVLLGKPITSCRVYVLGSDNDPAPIGVPGQLGISGLGVTLGYLNRPELTAEKFIANPFENGRIYLSGDIAKWHTDGNIEFVGRIDRQIKIRGHRIESEEIENQILTHPQVKDAVVRVAGDDNDNDNKYLIAYYVGKPGSPDLEPLDSHDLRKFLQERLPSYIIPSYFIPLPGIPLTSTGKIDWKKLPDPQPDQDDAGMLPQDETGKKLAHIWAEILGIEENTITRESHFFRLGGHSLNAAVLINQIHQELDVKLPLVEIFNNPTIRELAIYLENNAGTKFSAIPVSEKKEYYPLTSSQKRMFIAQQMEAGSKSYNTPSVSLVEGDIEPQRIHDTFIQLLERHESLRSFFTVIAKEPVQRVATIAAVDFDIAFQDIAAAPGMPGTPGTPNTQGAQNMEDLIKAFIRPFELSRAPLLRVGLIKKSAGEYILIVDMHHIIADGVSYFILVNDFMRLYNGKILSPLRIQYKDYAEWQSRGWQSGEIKNQEEYWLNRFQGDIPRLNLSTDYPRPAVRRIDQGDSLRFLLTDELAAKTMAIVEQTGTTVFMMLLAVFNIFLARYTRQEDIVVGTPVASRKHADLQEIIGVFINMLALRNQPRGNQPFSQFLAQVKENALHDYENQDYPFDDLVIQLGLQGDTSRNPLFDTEFALINVDPTSYKEEIPGLIFKPYPSAQEFAKFDLHFQVTEVMGRIHFMVRYSTQLFKKSTIEKMKKYYLEILEQVTDDIEIKLEDIQISHDFLVVKPKNYADEQGGFKL